MKVKKISAGRFSAAITENKKLYCWGRTPNDAKMNSPNLTNGELLFTDVRVG